MLGRLSSSRVSENLMPFRFAVKCCLNFRRLACMALLSAMLSGYPALAQSAGFEEEPGYFRVTIEGRTVRLQGMTVKRSDVAGKLPIALIAHGKPSNHAAMLDMQPTHLAGVARDLARRGWLAVIVLRRG